MRVCRFCNTENEDWMQICLECGNPLVSSSNEEEKDKEQESYNYSSSDVANFKGLKLTILILSIILAILLIYTLFVVFF